MSIDTSNLDYDIAEYIGDIKSKKLISLVPDSIKQSVNRATIKLLETTRVPKYTFICCEVVKIKNTTKSIGDTKKKEVFKRELTTGLAFINLSAQPSQDYVLSDMLEKRRGRILCYGNFPKPTDKTKGHYNSPNETNPYDAMENKALSLMHKEENKVKSMKSMEKKIREEVEEELRKKLEKEVKNDIKK